MDMTRTLIFDEQIVATKLTGLFDGMRFVELAVETYLLPDQERIRAYLWDFDEVDFSLWSEDEMARLIRARGEMRDLTSDMKPAIYLAAGDINFGIMRMQELGDPNSGKNYPIYVFRNLEEAGKTIDGILGQK